MNTLQKARLILALELLTQDCTPIANRDLVEAWVLVSKVGGLDPTKYLRLAINALSGDDIGIDIAIASILAHIESNYTVIFEGV